MEQSVIPNGFLYDEDILLSLLESFLFTFSDLIDILEIKRFFNENKIQIDYQDVEDLLALLKSKYESKSSGLQLSCVDGKYQIVTKSENYEYLSKILEPVKKKSLTQSVMETLAIIAYNQPTTKAYVEKIKGVKSDYAVSKLLETGLIKEVGKLDKIGRPTLYSTTDVFLKYMGINSLDELPKLQIQQQDNSDNVG
ncbi:SMC-Scp complex subunit ScpB [Criibacterium bergeronii]|uniref:SMC-Scp complex subunit ScpB n=1 Tax=Criibacterium bergeronii TaxID=1871336 RepID=A0A371IMN3_9FIRM|nr:SMC-Scp complex subunit ScpB [Criibacterium bergeronii]MBS6062337.1 SMC-Scp complex subunit ScpB [Peptostreptococcaceae bacterium]RDY21686.1 SMC-Scp complex subunit ScpB [Criibacterium bergeronii]